MFAFLLPLLVAIYLFYSRRKPLHQSWSAESIAVIVPFRNEVVHFPALVNSLSAVQLSPGDEVILVDDASETHLAVGQTLPESFQMLRREAQSGSKKLALEMGIRHAATPVVLTTDADCLHQPEWVGAMRKAIQADTRMVVGPVWVNGSTDFLSQIAHYESLCLWGVTQSAIQWKAPLICSGANLLFRISDWEAVSGYAAHVHIPSGDDVLLMRDFLRKPNGGIEFCDDPQALVTTAAPSSWQDWFVQKKRWASKTEHLQAWPQRIQGFFILIWLVSPLALPFYNIWSLIILLAVESIWMQNELYRYGREFSIRHYLIFRFSYPVLLLRVPFVKKQVWKN